VKELSKRVRKRYIKAIEKAYNLLETPIEIHVRSTQTGVTVDPISGEPVDPEDTMYNTTIRTVQAIARWGRPVSMERTAAGTIREEQCLVHCRIADILSDPSNENGDTYFHNAEKVVVDGYDCKVITPPHKLGIDKPYNVSVLLERSV